MFLDLALVYHSYTLHVPGVLIRAVSQGPWSMTDSVCTLAVKGSSTVGVLR